MKKKILITSATLYANGPIHFGHLAGAYLPADCYARFERMQGAQVLYISGSDEYGVAVAMSAEIANRTPKEHVDIFHEMNKKIFEELNISFDHYSRTTWNRHYEAVYAFFKDLLENGYIEEKETEQLYSEQDKMFFADRYVVGTCPRCGYDQARGDECTQCGASYEATDLIRPRSKRSNSPLTLKKTTHWFLRLDLMKERLEEWIKNKNWKPNVVNFILSYIKELRPRAITRDTHWGLPVPLDHAQDKVLYVWFDAPIGYISATKELAELRQDPSLTERFWCDPETKLVQFIGKDNIPFHAVIFPAMIMGQNTPYKLVDELPANEFYTLEGKQFSKSDGWFIDIEPFLERYNVDQLRYVIASNAPETSDSEFTWSGFQIKCNSDLVGKFGNFVHRTLMFIATRCAGKVPKIHELEERDQLFIQTINEKVEQAKNAYSTFSLRKASQAIMELSQESNIYFDAKKPWSDLKEGATLRMETTLALCLQAVQALSVISYPIMPKAAERIWQMLQYEKSLLETGWEKGLSQRISEKVIINTPETLFQKIEDSVIQEEIKKLQERSQKLEKKEKKEANFEDVTLLELRVGKILEATPVPKSKKLFQLQVDIGTEVRTIVSGIQEHFTQEQLIEKKVVVVTNMAPKKIMGVVSHGMLLVAESKSGLELLSSLSPVGSTIS